MLNPITSGDTPVSSPYASTFGLPGSPLMIQGCPKQTFVFPKNQTQQMTKTEREDCFTPGTEYLGMSKLKSYSPSQNLN